MDIKVCKNADDMGLNAALHGAQLLRNALGQQEEIAIIVATGASQFQTLSHLVAQPEIDWSRVKGFHLDEYLNLDNAHPASFCKYLKERFVDKVPLRSFEYVNGMAVDPQQECRRLSDILAKNPVEVAFVGIGENGHLAFNDPPADFDTTDPYIVVDLDEACRKQQADEGWFANLGDVPTQAISMSIQQILKSKHIVCSVPDERKAPAVKQTIHGDVSPEIPASILRAHPQCTLFLDDASASQL